MATDYNQLLCEKMQKEFDNLIEKFKSKEPAEILKHTYELTIKEDFLSECSLMELEPAKAKACIYANTLLTVCITTGLKVM